MDKDNFFELLKGKKVSFCGIGRTNLPLVEMFKKKGAHVSVRDRSENIGEAEEFLNKLGVISYLGKDYLKGLEDEDVVFRAPGVPFTLPEFQRAIRNGVTVTSELEVFFDLCPCKIFAITGSDGKTTTSSIIYEMLKADGKRVHLGGNIGKALLPLIEDISPYDYVVVELSSFQLISMRKSPDVAVITNISPNHLDVHKDMDEYIEAKKNIFSHQSGFSRTVINADNEITKSFAPEIRGEMFAFSRHTLTKKGAYVKDGSIYVNDEKVIDTKDIKLPGDHNIENYLAAICAVWGDVDKQSILVTARTFGGVAHRVEFVREFEGVKYFNDSIASSPTRVIAGTLSLHDEKIILIAGGADKGIDFDELGNIICKKVKVLILVKPEKPIDGFKPSAADKISLSVTKSYRYCTNNPIIIRVHTMDEAVHAAREIAHEGDIVSLSPACTAFDMFKDFEVRGNYYKEIVMKLNKFEDL